MGLLLFIYTAVGFVLFFAFIEEGAETQLAWSIFWPILVLKKALKGFVYELLR